MPMINIETPTNPALGKSSSAVSGGMISSELDPFIARGGAIDQDPGSISFAGQAKLGRHLFLRGPEEQKRIAGDIRTKRMTEYVNELLGQGFRRENANKLTKTEGVYKTTISLNWLTGNIDSSTSASASASRAQRRASSDLGSKYMNLIDDITKGKVQAAPGTVDRLKAGVNQMYGAEVYSQPKNVVMQQITPTRSSGGGGGGSNSYSSVVRTTNVVTRTPTGGSGSVYVGSAPRTTSTPSASTYRAVSTPSTSSNRITSNFASIVRSDTPSSRTGGTRVGNIIRNITSIFKKK